MSYATGDDLVARYDVDLVGDLATDDREPLDPVAVPNHPHVASALADASGEIDAALLSGGRYTAADLSSLTGNSLNHLKRVTCAIAMSHLFERRAGLHEDQAEKIAKKAREFLTALRRGENVFGIPAVIDAGTIECEGVTAVEMDNLNLLPDRMPRYFPPNDQRFPGVF